MNDSASPLHALRRALVTVLLILASTSATAQLQTQDVLLRPGWNSVFLEIEPESDDPAVLFAGLPLESVWMWNARFSAVQFVQDASTLVPAQPDWLVHFPALADEAFTSTLFSVPGGRAFLIEITGTEDVSLTITGKPLSRGPEWLPNSYTLIGLPVTDGPPSTFASYFADSPPQLQRPIYRIETSGQWVEVPPAATIERGEAYFVYTEGSSTYPGSFTVTLAQDGALEYGTALSEQVMWLKSTIDRGQDIDMATVASVAPTAASSPALAGVVPLSYYDVSEGEWAVLPPTFSLTLAARERLGLRLAVRRRDMAASPPAGGLYQSVLDLLSDTGTRNSVAVSSEGSTFSSPGLWVGTASVSAVNWAADPVVANRATPTPTRTEFPLRLIVHVDDTGQARLLSNVTLMWKDGTRKPDPNGSGNLVLDEPGRYVLVTRDALLGPSSPFLGASVRGGQQVGRRLSTAAFSFTDPLPMTGSFGVSLTAQVAIGFDSPRNPFLHRYHPDHDNLDFDFQPLPQPRAEAFDITRAIELEFTPNDPGGLASPGYGDDEIGGTYRETFTGLHKETVRAFGSFQLRRISLIGHLNDGL